MKQRIDDLGAGCFGVMLWIVLPPIVFGGLGAYWLLS